MLGVLELSVLGGRQPGYRAARPAGVSGPATRTAALGQDGPRTLSPQGKGAQLSFRSCWG